MSTEPTSFPAAFSKQSALATLVFSEGIFTIRFAGPKLAEREAGILAREIAGGIRHAGDRLRGLVLDMSDVEVLSSVGLDMCRDARRSAQERGAKTIIFGLCPRLQELMRTTRVDRLYTMMGSRAELRGALAA